MSHINITLTLTDYATIITYGMVCSDDSAIMSGSFQILSVSSALVLGQVLPGGHDPVWGLERRSEPAQLAKFTAAWRTILMV